MCVPHLDDALPPLVTLVMKVLSVFSVKELNLSVLEVLVLFPTVPKQLGNQNSKETSGIINFRSGPTGAVAALMCLCFSYLSNTTYRYTPEQQEALVSNVFLTGGNMQYPGMRERVERELLAMRPFQSHFKVCPFLKPCSCVEAQRCETRHSQVDKV